MIGTSFLLFQMLMNVCLKTRVGVSTSASTQWAATDVTVQWDSFYQMMIENAKVTIDGLCSQVN